MLQEQEKEELQCLEAEVKKKVADEEVATIKCRLKREEEEANINAKREVEHVALRKCLEKEKQDIAVGGSEGSYCCTTTNKCV